VVVNAVENDVDIDVLRAQASVCHTVYDIYRYQNYKLSHIGQPTWPTQPSIPQGSVNE